MSKQAYHGANAENDRSYEHLSKDELVALLERRDRQKARVGLNWSPDHAERDHAFNDDFVTMQLDEALCDRSAPWDSLIIEGDNFDALRWLRMTMRGRIKCIIVDPPYNIGGESWIYNDRYVDNSEPFVFTTWLEWLHRRFLLARDLLTEDGVILVNINDENRAMLELMLDQTLPGMKIGSLVWRSRTGGNDPKGPFISINHEHILAYGTSKFRFCGTEKTFDMYKSFDVERNDWFRLDNLTQPKDRTERPNGYYPIQNPENGVFYPANPNAVWRYASLAAGANRNNLRTSPIEDLIDDGKINFPENDRVEFWSSKEELKAAIDTGDVPHSGNAPKIWREMPDLDYWVGKKVGFGAPSFKRYKGDLKNSTQPLSSWITPNSEINSLPDVENSIVTGTNDEGTKALKSIFGEKVFNYPKPLSLVRELIRQSTSPGDIVLDFFAGSATAAHAVLQLNDEDQGERQFIMVSHDEATEQEPNRNICRDVTAERVRRLNKVAIDDENKQPAPFAYLKTLRKPIDELRNENVLSIEEVWLAVQAMNGLPLIPVSAEQVIQVNEDENSRVVYIHDLALDGALDALEAVAKSQKPTHVYTWTPALARDALYDANAEIHRLPSALTDRFAS